MLFYGSYYWVCIELLKLVLILAMYVCLCVYLWCLCAYVCVCVCVWMCGACLPMSVCFCVCTCGACVLMCMCVCVCMCGACVLMCVCVCVCVYVWNLCAYVLCVSVMKPWTKSLFFWQCYGCRRRPYYRYPSGGIPQLKHFSLFETVIQLFNVWQQFHLRFTEALPTGTGNRKNSCFEVGSTDSPWSLWST